MLFLITIHTSTHTPAHTHTSVDTYYIIIIIIILYYYIILLYYIWLRGRGVTNGLPSRGPLDNLLTLLRIELRARMWRRTFRSPYRHHTHTKHP